jgi:extracellular factor (EF) 3-hydroxypalmitic acid methyl ester biosynthesis protein
MTARNGKPKEPTEGSSVSYQTREGLEAQGRLVGLSPHQVVFENYAPFTVIRTSEALQGFQIFSGGRVVYSGRAVVNSVLETGAGLVCQAELEETWLHLDPATWAGASSDLCADFAEFIRASQAAFKILPEFKLVVADLQIFLQDLKDWSERVELGVLAQPFGSRAQFERDAVRATEAAVFRFLGALFERFEDSCRRIDPGLQPAHRAYIKRQLHPFVLCAPFMYRTFRKPLGYAGDYEMVNMMVRDPIEGATLFAKALNSFFLSTAPVVAHRNRIGYMVSVLTQEAARVSRQNRELRVFNLGCGPAKEVEEFVARSELSQRARFTLLDFNDETLAYTSRVLKEAVSRFHRDTGVRLVRKAVVQLLKEAANHNPGPETLRYDLVYCAGLFDYMPDQICRQLTAILYRFVAPGGLLVVTNVDECNPSRNWMEYSVDWHLIYRNSREMATLVPETVPADGWRLLSEATGVNAFLEIRKPGHV